MSQPNPLDGLFVDQQPLDLQLLADIIRPYIELQKAPPKVDFTLRWGRLSNAKKILTYILGRKALSEFLRDKAVDVVFSENATPGVIEAETGITGGSVRPTLKSLKEQRLLREADGYFVPNSALPRVREHLQEEAE